MNLLISRALKALAIILVLGLMFPVGMCGLFDQTQSVSDSGVTKATVKLPTDANGNTVEQRNIMERLKRDNKIGSFKYLYVINAYTNDVVFMSVVRGKVSSSGKRLTPRMLAGRSQYSYDTMDVTINGVSYNTAEVIEDDGTYGDSVPYIYWFDSNDVYHQQFINGGSIIHVADQLLNVPKAKISIDMVPK